MKYLECKHCHKKGVYGKYHKVKGKWKLDYVTCRYCHRKSN